MQKRNTKTVSLKRNMVGGLGWQQAGQFKLEIKQIFSATEEISGILRNPEVYYRIFKTPFTCSYQEPN
jgi:hypothetical protein